MIHHEADVVIIGGGIAGSSTALRLAEKGQRVILLEKGRVGEEASGRCGGGVRQQNRLLAELPLAMEAIKIWGDMQDELDCDVGYRRCGNVKLIMTPEDHSAFHKIYEKEKGMGLGVEMLSPKEIHALVPALAEDATLLGGKYCPTDGAANPLLVVKAICRAARSKGVEIIEHEAVTKLATKSGRITSAITKAGEYRGSVFVIAAGPWARKICNMVDLNFPLTVHKDYIVVTEPIPHYIEPFISYNDMYLRQAPEGNVHLSGGHHLVDNFDKGLSYSALAHAANRSANLFPKLHKARVIRAFAGVTCYMPDGMPILDRSPDIDNLYVSAGFHGHGFCLGPIVGKLFSEWIVDGKPSLNLSDFRWARYNHTIN